jgi:hypothetical protein
MHVGVCGLFVVRRTMGAIVGAESDDGSDRSMLRLRLLDPDCIGGSEYEDMVVVLETDENRSELVRAEGFDDSVSVSITIIMPYPND